MNKGKSFLTVFVLALLLGLVILPVSANAVMSQLGQDPNLKFKLYLPGIINQAIPGKPNTEPQGAPTAVRATLTATPRTATNTPVQSRPTNTATLLPATRTPTQVRPTNTPTRPAATNTPTLTAPTRPAATNTPTLPAPTRPAATNTPTLTAPTRPAATNTPTLTAPTRTPTQPVPTTVPTQPPAPGSSFTFLAWGDTKGGTSTLASLSNQAVKLNPAFGLYVGDLENAGFTTSGIATWTKALNGNSSNGMFDRTFTIRGNHDTSNTTGWQTYFNAQGNAANIGATQFSSLSTDLTYAFDYGNAYFILIDVPGDASLITSSQIAFLDSGLAGAESRGLTHAFVFLHGPVYPVSSHTSCTTRVCSTNASVANLVKALNKHSIVSAVFNGHEHVQSYVHMDNTRVPEITHPFEQFIAGAAGAPLYPCDKTYRFDYCGSYAGFDTITVSGKTFTIKVYQQNNATPVKTYTFTKP